MSEVRQVKVDNWGIYFLQKLKNFFNRTDYCDLTLQFQDNAQLKVHRLVLSACTEYFELLERTCEMYEDCLVMPDDLQADVVVPIVNFMYTGQLEFRMDLLEKLHQTSEIMNMGVLTKLLESHRNDNPTTKPLNSYGQMKRISKQIETLKIPKQTLTTSAKRSYGKAFKNNLVSKEADLYTTMHKSQPASPAKVFGSSSPYLLEFEVPSKKSFPDPRPTRYEIPEELEHDSIYDNSFCSISYTSQPLMVDPDTSKQYSSKRSKLFSHASSSRKFGNSSLDIVECKKMPRSDIFEDSIPERIMDDSDIYHHSSYMSMKDESAKDASQLFDQILEQNDNIPKLTIETKDSKLASNIDHAKIISEVLKKYPHLVKHNKNIKLKILDTQSKGITKKLKPTAYLDHKQGLKSDIGTDFTYESDVIDSKQAAKLIAMGADNIKGPWICLICGTPGKALHFTSYYKYRRHLVEVHKEKPLANICEYCGQKSLKRNYLLHHLYSKHGVPPPPQYNFPKCNQCNYIALTEAFLVKHKITHNETKNFRCNVCPLSFHTSNQLLSHIQVTGHKYSGERKTNLQCIYCLKVFLRESNLYAHLKTNHKNEAKKDGVIDDSDDEKVKEEKPKIRKEIHNVTTSKFEPVSNRQNLYEDVGIQYQIQQRPDGNIHVVTKKTPQIQQLQQQQHNFPTNSKQKILNSGFDEPNKTTNTQKTKAVRTPPTVNNDFLQDMSLQSTYELTEEQTLMIDNVEYIMKDHRLVPKNPKQSRNDEFILSDIIDEHHESIHNVQIPTTTVEFANMIKKTTNLNEPFQIVVSSEEEYKALMSSNHPIIFDGEETNKTLTVLTTPHNAPFDTSAIDLDNTQPSDMMIIQDPLIPQGVTADNSNIVVVYSHPVNDQNKQYQLITSQALDAQFVQSSAILTQSYGTVSTAAPVMSAHVIETPIQEAQVMEAPVQPTHIIQTPVEMTHVMETAVQDAQVLEPQITSAHIIQASHESANVIETPQQSGQEVDTSIPSGNVLEAPVVGTHLLEAPMQSSHVLCAPEQDTWQETIDKNSNSQQIDKTIKECLQSNDIEMAPVKTATVDNLSAISEQQILPEQAHVPEPMEQIVEPLNEVDVSTEVHNIVALQNTEQIACEDIQSIAIAMNVDAPPTETIVETEVPLVHHSNDENLVENQNQVRYEVTTTIEAIETNTVSPEGKSLDDTEDHNVPNEITANQSSEVVEKINSITVEQPECPAQEVMHIPSTTVIEESIPATNNPTTLNNEASNSIHNLTSEWSEDENDSQNTTYDKEDSQDEQQINNKQLSDPVPELEESIENIQQEVQKQISLSLPGNSKEKNDIEQPQTNVAINNPAPHEKISSLLNDWDDNDSQEEIEALKEKPNEEIKSVPVDNRTSDNSPEKNIKSLVSDWDDDDDDDENSKD